MKKIIKFIIGIAVLSALQYFLLGDFCLKSDIISSIITFLSIVFGFYITSLAIFVTSSYVAELYKITDQNNKSVTLLHTLISNYRFGLTFILSTILYLLILQFIINQSVDDKILLSAIYALPFLFFVIFNFFYSYKMLNDLIKIIIQESKRHSRKK